MTLTAGHGRHAATQRQHAATHTLHTNATSPATQHILAKFTQHREKVQRYGDRNQRARSPPTFPISTFQIQENNGNFICTAPNRELWKLRAKRIDKNTGSTSTAFTAPHLQLMQNHSGGDSVALGIVSLFPHLLGSLSPPVPLRRQLDVKQV